jgi:hypothetical protein
MISQLSQSRPFLTQWILFNMVGFTVGSLLGATDDSLTAALLGASLPARIVGDLVFGLCIGLAQFLVFRRHFPQGQARLIGWIPVIMIGFTLGARLGARFAPGLSVDLITLAVVFGIFLGGSVGLVGWAGMRLLNVLQADQPAAWVPTCIAAWILAECVAFPLGLSQLAMPLVSLVIGVVTGAGLILWVRPR